jgi:uncharacterized membrane protein
MRRFSRAHLFAVALALELCFDATMLVLVVLRSDNVAVPGGIVRLLGMTCLGVFAIFGHAWARWLFVVFEGLTAGVVALFSFVPIADGEAFVDLRLLGVGMAFAIIAALAALGSDRASRRSKVAAVVASPDGHHGQRLDRPQSDAKDSERQRS